jgi:sulfate transport system permease protein
MNQEGTGELAMNRHRSWQDRMTSGIAIAMTMAIVIGLLAIPVASIFFEAFREGWNVFARSLVDPAAISAIQLTLLVVAIAVPLNTIFGVAAAVALTRYEFRGKTILGSIIDLPFAVSPVISGLIFVLLFGSQGWLGPIVGKLGFQIIFAIPGIVLATIFVTVPFVARELIPLMQEQGSEEELAAISLGATGWQTFWRITLPKIRWGLFYGVALCTARALGEFGAVSVVSGHIRGKTTTMPLHVEILYNEYNIPAAFAMASLLAVAGLASLVVKEFLHHRMMRQRQQDAIQLPGS